MPQFSRAELTSIVNNNTFNNSRRNSLSGDVGRITLQNIIDSTYNKIDDSAGLVQVQSDWNESNSAAVDYIKNKPTISSRYIVGTTITNSFSVGINFPNNGYDVIMILDGTGTITSGSISFGTVDSSLQGIVMIRFVPAVTLLTMSSGAGTIESPLTSATAGLVVMWAWDANSIKWRRLM
jgi:hypothetical protein